MTKSNDYDYIQMAIRRKNRYWENVLSQFKKIHDFEDFKFCYVKGLEEEAMDVHFYHIGDLNLVEWTYDLSEHTLLIKSTLLTEVSDIELRISNKCDYTLTFKVGDISHEIKLNDAFDRDSRVDDLVCFYKHLSRFL